jgi:hypothetical protein
MYVFKKMPNKLKYVWSAGTWHHSVLSHVTVTGLLRSHWHGSEEEDWCSGRGWHQIFYIHLKNVHVEGLWVCCRVNVFGRSVRLSDIWKWAKQVLHCDDSSCVRCCGVQVASYVGAGGITQASLVVTTIHWWQCFRGTCYCSCKVGRWRQEIRSECSYCTTCHHIQDYDFSESSN